MTLFRRHLRLCVTAWLVFQAVSLSAFVPRDCCAGHRVPPPDEREAEASCHQPPEPAASDTEQCALRGTCNGPLGMLATLLSPQAVLTATAAFSGHAATGATEPPSFESPRPLFVPPDSPPPRR
jgi:hypothetical protein